MLGLFGFRWPVDGWARYQFLAVVLHASAGGSRSSCLDESSTGLRALGAARGDLGTALKDLKTELGELQEALTGSGDLSDDSVYASAGEEGAAAAAADLAYYLGAMGRAAQLGVVVVRALQPKGTPTEACLTKEQRQFFKALRPKAQSVARGFLQVLGPSPPIAAVNCGAAALLKLPQGGAEWGSSPPAVLTSDLLSVHAWVSLLLPAVQLAMMAAALGSSPGAAAAYAKEAALEALSSTAMATLGIAAKQAIRSTGAAMGPGGSAAAAGLAGVLCPLLQCLCEQLLPAANAQQLQGAEEAARPEESLEGRQEDEAEPFCRLSEVCPELFEALVQLYGASTSRVDAYICQILTLDSGGPNLSESAAECAAEGHSAGAEGLEVSSGPSQAGDQALKEAGAAREATEGGSCEVFSSEFTWMAELPDFREVFADTSTDASVASSPVSQRVRLRLAGPCDWLALDPRRVKETLDAFAFHAKLVQPRRFAAEQQQSLCRWDPAAATGVEKLQVHLQLQSALKARASVGAGGEFEETTQGGADCRETVVWASQLARRLEDLGRSYELRALRETSAGSSAYDVGYLVPYLTGRLTTACFVLMWRWQRLLEEEQEHQQQTRLQLQQHLQQKQQREGEEDNPSAPSSDPLIALSVNRPVCAAEQARRACGVAGAWLRFLEETAKKEEEAAGIVSSPEGPAGESEGPSEGVGGTQVKETPSATGAEEPEETSAQQNKRRREDVWEMDEFNPQEVQPAVTRVSTFLKAARRIGRLWRPLSASTQEAGKAGADGDREIAARKLEAWGASIDDGDQWLSSFASGGGLQLLIMALGCPVSGTDTPQHSRLYMHLV